MVSCAETSSDSTIRSAITLRRRDGGSVRPRTTVAAAAATGWVTDSALGDALAEGGIATEKLMWWVLDLRASVD
jgi:hypothetical protein